MTMSVHLILWFILSVFLLGTHAFYVFHPFFYNNNTQRCNCEPNTQCNYDGTCASGVCASGYVGIHCQQANVGLIMKHTNVPLELRDGNESTCLTSPVIEPVVYQMKHPSFFVWVYISRKSTEPMDPHLVLYKEGVSLTVDSYLLMINKESLLLKLRKTVRYDELQLFNLPGDACSLEVSIGRNLALSSTPYQSSVDQRIGGSTSDDALKAIDGNENPANVNGPSPSCIHTQYPPGRHEWWHTRLKYDAVVNAVEIVFSSWQRSCRMANFVLKTYTSDETPVFSYRDNDTRSKPVDRKSIIVPVDVEKLIRFVEISVSKGPIFDFFCKGHGILSFCELYIFGEFRCPAKMYGPLCEHDCTKGCRRELCDPDWGCPQGCKGHWSGERCNIDCHFRYGDNCESTCPDECGGVGECDRITGACLEGCFPGFFPPNCTDPCPSGTFGVNCSKSCFNCRKNSSSLTHACDHSSGACLLGCDAGYGGDRCEKLLIINRAVDAATKFGMAGGFIFILLMVCYKSASADDYESSAVKDKEKQEHATRSVAQTAIKESPGNEMKECGGSSTDPEPPRSESSESSEGSDSETDESSHSSDVSYIKIYY